jgi:MinD-like ATPase involved in chromosome partitioning or flagellar assembly
VSHGVLVALTGDLEQATVTGVDAARDLVVVRRCADIAELVAAALAGLGSVAVVDAGFAPDRSLVTRLAQAGTSTVVVCESADQQRYASIGASAVAADEGVAAIVAAVSAAAAAVPTTVAEITEQAQPTAQGQAPGGLAVVWGPAGAPGRTTVAINLAAEIAASGQRVLLIDADLWGAAIAPSLGLLEESAGIAAAVRAADQGTLEPASLRRLCTQVNDNLLVLPGLPRSSRWREVSGAGIDAVWDPARRLADWVVVEAGVWVPDDDRVGGFDAVLGARRNAVTASAMAAADALVVVGAAEPIGIQRLVQTLLDLDGRPEVSARRHVVVTRVRSEAAGPRPADSVREALHRFAGIEDVLIVPDDRPALDKACLAGATLTEMAPRSPAREAHAALAERLTGVVAPAGSRRRRRRRS